MASLKGSTVASSYKSLLKLNGNTDTLVAGTGSNAIQIVHSDDSTGVTSPLFLNTDRLGIGGQPSVALEVKGDGDRIVVSSADYNLVKIGAFGDSGGALDVGFINLLEDGTERIKLLADGDSFFTNNLGIGGTPSSQLHITQSGTDTADGIRLTRDGGESFNLMVGTIGQTAGGFSIFDITDNAVRLSIDTSGNINIPQKLEIGGDVVVSEYIKHEGDTDTNIRFQTDHIDLTTANTLALRVDNNQKIGIGVSSPSEFVDIEKSDNTHRALQFTNTNAGSGASGGFKATSNAGTLFMRTFATEFTTSGKNVAGSSQLLSTATGGLVLATTNGTADMSFWTNSTQRLTIEGDTGDVGIGTDDPSFADVGGDNLVIVDSANAGITLRSSTGGNSSIYFAKGDTGTDTYKGIIQYSNSDNEFRFWTNHQIKLKINSTGDILPAVDNAQDLGSSSLRFDDIFAESGTVNSSDERLKDNIADSSLGLEFINALRPVEYKFKDYTYDIEKEKAVEAEEAVYETVVVKEAVEAKEAVMGTRQKTVSKEVEKTKTEIVEEDGKYVQKEISYTETVEEPQYEEVNLYDEDGNKIQRLVSEAIEAVEGVEAKDAVYEDVLHKIPVMEEYEVEPAVEAVEEITEERLVSEAIEAKDAVMETKEKTFARTHFGLIAQEVEQVLKDSSLTNNDFAGLIYDEDADRYGIRYHELISPLIKAVQELSAKVTELENK